MKIKALLRIRSQLSLAQAKLLFSSFVLPMFQYCPFVWMFSSKMAHNLVNSTYRRALCAIVHNFSLNARDLLRETGSLDIHTRNLNQIFIEVRKSLLKKGPSIMWGIFEQKPQKYNLRHTSSLLLPTARTNFDQHCFDFRAALAWNMLSNSIKCANAVISFQKSLVNTDIYCRCNLYL